MMSLRLLQDVWDRIKQETAETGEYPVPFVYSLDIGGPGAGDGFAMNEASQSGLDKSGR